MTLFSGVALVIYQFLIIGSFVGIAIYSVGQIYNLFRRGGWRSLQGRYLAFLGVSLTLAFLFISLRIIFGDFPARAAISMVLVLLLFVSVWWLTIMWAVGEIRARRNKRKTTK